MSSTCVYLSSRCVCRRLPHGCVAQGSQLLIDQRNYSHLTTYVFKADAALDAAKAAAAPPPAPAGVTAAGAAQQKKKAAAGGEREDVQAKLSLATALSHLGQGHYEKAASSFLTVGSPTHLGEWLGKVTCGMFPVDASD
jgi:COP9 signalosome complex subunit 1